MREPLEQPGLHFVERAGLGRLKRRTLVCGFHKLIISASSASDPSLPSVPSSSPPLPLLSSPLFPLLPALPVPSHPTRAQQLPPFVALGARIPTENGKSRAGDGLKAGWGRGSRRAGDGLKADWGQAREGVAERRWDSGRRKHRPHIQHVFRKPPDNCCHDRLRAHSGRRRRAEHP